MIRLTVLLTALALCAPLSSDAKAEGLGYPSASPRVLQPRVLQPRTHLQRRFAQGRLLEGAIIVVPQAQDYSYGGLGLEEDYGLSSFNIIEQLPAVINPFPLFPRRFLRHHHHRLGLPRPVPALRGLRGGISGGGLLRRR